MSAFVRTIFRSLLESVLLSQPLTVVPARHSLDPIFIVKIPVHGLAYAVFKVLVRFPPQFPLDFAGVNRITPVMTRPILDEGDELAVRHHRVVRPELVEKGADRGHNWVVSVLD